MPLFFDRSELPQFEQWLDGQDKKQRAYAGTDEEHYFVLEQYNRIIGCGGFYISVTDKKAVMTWGMIESTQHHRGFGRMFLKYRLELIEQQHPGFAITLDTSQYSVQFFEKLGFKVTKITPDYYGAGMHRHDMIKLNWKWQKQG
jgi:N-acetylglutamate synthase-like GNAT family acetyltransferase